MWLLDTATAILHKFDGPEDVREGYAILSHVWGKPEEEDTFQSVQTAAKKCDENAARAPNQTQSMYSVGPTELTPSDLLGVVMKLQRTVQMQAEMLSALSARMDQFESGSSPRTVVSEGAQDQLTAATSTPYPEDTVYIDPPQPFHVTRASSQIRFANSSFKLKTMASSGRGQTHAASTRRAARS